MTEKLHDILSGSKPHVSFACVCVCQCDVLIEQYEEVIEDWYKGSQEEDLTTYLCAKHVLKGQDAGNAYSDSHWFDPERLILVEIFLK